MQLARVVGTVVSTSKHRTFDGAKLLLVQPVNPDGTVRGVTLLAVDGVGAGESEPGRPDRWKAADGGGGGDWQNGRLTTPPNVLSAPSSLRERRGIDLKRPRDNN